MRRVSLQDYKATEQEDHPELERLVARIHQGRYFRRIRVNLLKNMIRHGTLLYLEEDEYLLREGEEENIQEMYILVNGSLAVMSQSKFILRLQLAGDVVGEVAVIDPAPRSADVVAEEDCQLIAFSGDLFQVEDDAQMAPIFYVMFAHVLAEKLRVTTAQSLIRRDNRVSSEKYLKVAVIDSSEIERNIILGILEKTWPEIHPVEYSSGEDFLKNPLEHRFSLFIVDILSFQKDGDENDQFKHAFGTMRIHGVPVFVISEYCAHPAKRDLIREHGAEEILGKPYAIEDVIHRIEKFRLSFYQQKELDRVEIASETDQLTGVANRRRMDEYLEALVALVPEKMKSFSFIITDVDNFKHYNDTNGHQMGDIVLAKVASTLSKNIRRGDLAARYGGEEFVVILPSCSLENAYNVAEKLRKLVEEVVFPHQEKQPTGNLTATFGVSSFPPAKTIKELIQQADHCLYRGKEAGRNVVITADFEII